MSKITVWIGWLCCLMPILIEAANPCRALFDLGNAVADDFADYRKTDPIPSHDQLEVYPITGLPAMLRGGMIVHNKTTFPKSYPAGTYLFYATPLTLPLEEQPTARTKLEELDQELSTCLGYKWQLDSLEPFGPAQVFPNQTSVLDNSITRYHAGKRVYAKLYMERSDSIYIRLVMHKNLEDPLEVTAILDKHTPLPPWFCPKLMLAERHSSSDFQPIKGKEMPTDSNNTQPYYTTTLRLDTQPGKLYQENGHWRLTYPLYEGTDRAMAQETVVCYHQLLAQCPIPGYKEVPMEVIPFVSRKHLNPHPSYIKQKETSATDSLVQVIQLVEHDISLSEENHRVLDFRGASIYRVYLELGRIPRSQLRQNR